MRMQDFAGFSAIAVGLDGSRLSEATLPMVKELARQFDARISLITVLDPHVGERFAEYCHSEGVTLDHAVRAYQERLIQDLRDDGLLVAGHVVELRGLSTPDTIREVAEHVHASLLVVGAHGRPGLGHIGLGSTAEALTSSGHLPVLVVRPSRAEAYAEI
ncbi:MAG TPA: universal stress protein [Acidimicrobiia bacterium]|jgi:nucleotide-binding universal stress UspA family protein|nr:universal stress protein [Acidimicrobiia bacterium]